MSLSPFRNPSLKNWYKVTRRAPKGHGTWVYDPPLTPILSPLEKGGRGCREWGDGKRDILGWYRLKRKSVPGNGITLSLPRHTPFGPQSKIPPP
jgi:hypothetical protein